MTTKLIRAGLILAVLAVMFVLAATVPTSILVAGVSILAFVTFGAYVALAPWWTTRAGRALFVLFASLVILCAHFIVEQVIGQSPMIAENFVVLIVGAALAFNALTIAYKQWHFRGKDRP